MLYSAESFISQKSPQNLNYLQNLLIRGLHVGSIHETKNAKNKSRDTDPFRYQSTLLQYIPLQFTIQYTLQ